MAFKTFETREELIEIILSVEDTAIICPCDTNKAFKKIKNMGFNFVHDKGNFSFAIGETFYFEYEDNLIYFSFSKPESDKGVFYLIQKCFFKDSISCFHRLDKPCYVSYHSNGTVFKQKYRFNNDTYPVILVDGVEHSHLECITKKRTYIEYHFRKQPWHAKFFRVNINTLNVMNAKYWTFEEYDSKFLDYHQIKKAFPEINKFRWHEKINLGKNVASDELSLIHSLIQMILY